MRRKRWLVIIPLLTAAAVGILVCLIAAYYALWSLTFDLDRVSRMPSTSVIYDRNGYVLQRLYEEHRIIVDADDIPEVLRQAILAKEDARFYWHPGIDPLAIGRSLVVNIVSGEVQTGASTITQQLARNSAGMFERTLDRKFKEMFLALRIEAAFSKDEILTFYLNRIFFGSHLYGVGAAAEAYFGKHPRELTLGESALLAGIVAAPNAFTPWNNPEEARRVRAFTLNRMARKNFISRETAQAVAAEPLRLRPILDLPGTYITSVVRDQLPEFVTEEILFRGGLHIHTTIDASFQKAARGALQERLTQLESAPGYPHPSRSQIMRPLSSRKESPDYLQGAFVALSNVDGGILAVVGGRRFDESTFNRALNARRQIGSTIKPFLYAHAFNVLNATAFTEVDKSAFDLRTAGAETPLAGEKPDFISVREALETSNNYAAMRLGLAAGPESFSFFMSRLVQTPVAPFPSTFLGACSMSPVELVSAFSIFPNYGVALHPYLIQSIELHDGKLLYQRIDQRRRVLSPAVAFQIHDLLAGVVDRGTGRALRRDYGLEKGLGGKTGTTNDYKDAWFAGYTSEITAAVWVGFDQPKPIMPGGYASRVALPVWGDIMKLANEHYPPKEFFPPPGVERVQRKKTSKFLWIFKSEKAEGPAEFVRDEQRETALARLDNQFEPIPFQPEEKSLARKAWEWVFPPQVDDQFQATGDPLPRAIIHQHPETEAPRAEPIQ